MLYNGFLNQEKTTNAYAMLSNSVCDKLLKIEEKYIPDAMCLYWYLQRFLYGTSGQLVLRGEHSQSNIAKDLFCSNNDKRVRRAIKLLEDIGAVEKSLEDNNTVVLTMINCLEPKKESSTNKESLNNQILNDSILNQGPNPQEDSEEQDFGFPSVNETNDSLDKPGKNLTWGGEEPSIVMGTNIQKGREESSLRSNINKDNQIIKNHHKKTDDEIVKIGNEIIEKYENKIGSNVPETQREQFYFELSNTSIGIDKIYENLERFIKHPIGQRLLTSINGIWHTNYIFSDPEGNIATFNSWAIGLIDNCSDEEIKLLLTNENICYNKFQKHFRGYFARKNAMMAFAA
jgi:hypothetical protein